MKKDMAKIDRRRFLAGIVAASAAGTLRGTANGTVAATGTGPLKVCVFSDLHYRPGAWTNTENTSFLEKIMARAERERCDMMIHCGDLLHGVRTDRKSVV